MRDPSPAVIRLLRNQLGTPALGRVTLSAQVSAYLTQVQEETLQDPFVDAELARQIADVLHTLLKEVPDGDLPWLQAAVRYFVRHADLEDDITSLTGFDDDAVAVAWVADQVERPDLAGHLRDLLG